LLDPRGDSGVGANGVDAVEGAFEFKHGRELAQGVQFVAFLEQAAWPGLKPAVMHQGAKNLVHPLRVAAGGPPGFPVYHDLPGGQVATLAN
jgi:hypothetical protein